MKRTLCFWLIGLVVYVNANSISIAKVPTNDSEHPEVTDAPQKSVSDAIITSPSETKKDTPSETSARGIYPGYRERPRFGRSPWFSSMFPFSPFSDEFDSLYYGSSHYGDEDGYRRRYPSARYGELYPGAFGRYGMMGQYDGLFYPGYPAYNQQLSPSPSYYSSRPEETNARPQEYYRGQSAEPQRFPTLQGTPYDRNRIESRPHDRNQPHQFASPSTTAYYQDQRRESQPFNQDQRRDSQGNSNVVNPDASLTNGSYGILRKEPQHVAGVPASRRTSEFTIQPQAVPVPAREQPMETSPTITVPAPSDERTQGTESNVRP